MVYTTSSAFLKLLSNAGTTHAFVNWGSDHPALLEDLQRQRSDSSSSNTNPEIITCPNEMVALSAAQGYAQVAGKPALVIVHVDVGTQALAGAIHNVDRGRTPVIIYAGASAYSGRGEVKGGRNEWIMWIQDIPDQPAVVRQYMRHTAQIHSGKNVDQVVGRAFQIATSEPKGPVYLWARREAMEEELSPDLFTQLTASRAPHALPINPSALSPNCTRTLLTALLDAENPIIITSHLGRNPRAVPVLAKLSTELAIPLYCSCPSVVNVPFSHPYFMGVSFLAPGSATDAFVARLEKADVVLVVESDVPWVPLKYGPKEGAKVFVMDSGDPLKTTSGMGMWEMSLHNGVEGIWRVDPEVGLGQVLDALQREAQVEEVKRRIDARKGVLQGERASLVVRLESEVSSPPSSSGCTTVPQIIDALNRTTTQARLNTLFLNETISNYGVVWEHLKAEQAGSVLSSGGSSLGWALAASVGAFLANKVGEKKYDLVVAVVGDGSYMFGVPSSAYWVARRYGTPFLTVILNNGGWKSPKLSMLGVHPDGFGSKALSGDQLSVGFGFPSSSSDVKGERESPDYPGIAVAATNGWAWGAHVGGGAELERTLKEAVRVVLEEKRCAVVDCALEVI